MGSNSQCPNCRAELPFNIADQIVLARGKGQCAACPYCSCNLEFFQQVQPQETRPNHPNEQFSSSEPPPFQRYHPYKPEPPSTSWLGAQVPAGEKPYIPQEKRPEVNIWKKVGIVAAISLATLISASGFIQSAIGRQIFRENSSSAVRAYPPTAPEAPTAPTVSEWSENVSEQNEGRETIEVPAELGETMFLYGFGEAKSMSLTLDGVEDFGSEVGDFEADPGDKIMGIDFTLSNNSSNTSYLYLDIQFNWISTSGNEVSAVPMNYTGLIPDQASPSMMLKPGKEISGTLYFTVPGIDDEDYTISIQNNDYYSEDGERISYEVLVESGDVG